MKKSIVSPLLALAVLLPPQAPAEEPGGFSLDVAYTGEPIRNLRGGLQRGSSYLDNLDIQLSADRGSLFGIPGLSGLLYVLRNNTSEFSSEFVGDAQVVSNIDAPGDWRLFEAWLDWAPGDSELFSARLGLYDINSEFDSIETAGLFLASAQGMGTDFGQTGQNGPSTFPVSALALRLLTTAENGAYGQFAVADGVPGNPDDPTSNRIDLSSDDGALLTMEGGWAGGDWRKLAVGFWHYTGDFDRLVGAIDDEPLQGDGNSGWYLIADRTLWSGDGGTAAGYLRYGRADDRYNVFDGYLGTGVTLTGFWPGRADDTVGLAVAMAFTGSDYRQSQHLAGEPADSHETSIELTYRAPVTDWLTLQPSTQYIVNPGTNPLLDDAWTIALRFEIALSYPFGG